MRPGFSPGPASPAGRPQMVLWGLVSFREETMATQNDRAKTSGFLNVFLPGRGGLPRPEFFLNLKGTGIFHPQMQIVFSCLYGQFGSLGYANKDDSLAIFLASGEFLRAFTSHQICRNRSMHPGRYLEVLRREHFYLEIFTLNRANG